MMELALLVVKLIVASCLQSCGQPKDFFYLFIATKDCWTLKFLLGGGDGLWWATMHGSLSRKCITYEAQKLAIVDYILRPYRYTLKHPLKWCMQNKVVSITNASN